ncbi:MAG TPA: DUF2121 domain-containing protein, partial [Methanomicrobiales archaeon]|nr:DUF2121 domain-containing protein [Methanomicrobiales archaeon]
VILSIRDVKVTARERAGVLVGEVSSVEGGMLKSRRLYASAGSYAILDFGEASPTLRRRGGAGNFVVLGNERTKAIAHRCIREGWKNGNLRDAAAIIRQSLEEAARASASVSREFVFLETREKADLERLMEQDGFRDQRA